jgi:hypothetical protein
MSSIAVVRAGQLRANLLETLVPGPHHGCDIKSGAPPSFPAFDTSRVRCIAPSFVITATIISANLVFTNTVLLLVHRSARYASGRVASRKTTPSGQSSHHETMY